MEFDIILEDAGVAFELESSDLTRNEFVGEKSQRTHLKAQRPSRFFCDSVRPIRAFHSAVRCSGTLMASKLTILKGTGSVLGISWSHSTCDGNAMMTFIDYWAFLCRHKRHSVLASLRTLQRQTDLESSIVLEGTLGRSRQSEVPKTSCKFPLAVVR